MTNFRAYALAGAQYSIDLASQAKKKEDNLELLKINPHNYQFIIGGGTDFYLKYFKFGIELRSSFGIPDMLKRENTIYTDNIESLRSKMLWLCFTFE